MPLTKPVSQEDLIFRHLELGGSITPLDALNLYGCFRLGARIWDLRQKGYNIQMKLVGDKKRYAQYSLKKEERRFKCVYCEKPMDYTGSCEICGHKEDMALGKL